MPALDAELMFPERRDARLVLGGAVVFWVGVVGSLLFVLISDEPSQKRSSMPPEIALLWVLAAIGATGAVVSGVAAARARTRLRVAQPQRRMGFRDARQNAVNLAAARRLGISELTARTVALFCCLSAGGLAFLVGFGNPFAG